MIDPEGKQRIEDARRDFIEQVNRIEIEEPPVRHTIVWRCMVAGWIVLAVVVGLWIRGGW